MKLDDISPELEARIAACETPEAFSALVGEEGIELSDEQMEAVVGGRSFFAARPDRAARPTFSHAIGSSDTRDTYADARLDDTSEPFGAFILSLFRRLQ